jgi:GDP/UDP-N,N'-diacetylbacillosamine 2-epimerase (hydrolysing)
MSVRKICVVTGSRAEYGSLFPVMKKIQKYESLELQIVATTMHFSGEFGNTYKKIEEDGFFINEKIENLLSSDTKGSIAKSAGLATILLSDVFLRLEPSIVLLLGDRFETHAAATTAMLMNIPIAHIHGGEITEGAIDEKIRHSITKMSSLHFVSTNEYRDRIIQMGESPESVFFVGAPGLENIVNMKLLSQHELENKLNWKISQPTALFTYHPETLSTANIKHEIRRILSIIRDLDINILFTYANSDNGGRIINNEIEKFVLEDNNKYLVVKNLGQLKYLSAMKNLDLMIGNTSSGIIEAASFCKPVVNIGNRQSGRIRSGNVIDCNIADLKTSVEFALSNDFIAKCSNQRNLYSNENTTDQIIQQLINQPLSVIKKFLDVNQ